MINFNLYAETSAKLYADFISETFKVQHHGNKIVVDMPRKFVLPLIMNALT